MGYGLRFWWGSFADKPGIKPIPVGRNSRVMVAPVVILATLGLILGIGSSWWSHILELHAETYPGTPGHLALWHGLGAPILITTVVLI